MDWFVVGVLVMLNGKINVDKTTYNFETERKCYEHLMSTENRISHYNTLALKHKDKAIRLRIDCMDMYKFQDFMYEKRNFREYLVQTH